MFRTFKDFSLFAESVPGVCDVTATCSQPVSRSQLDMWEKVGVSVSNAFLV